MTNDKRFSVAAKARERLLEKARAVDFAKMRRKEYDQWINELPLDEFSALLSVHQEFLSRERAAIPENKNG